MRKLAWFSGGFSAACLWARYRGLGALPAGIAVALLAAALTAWLASRPRADGDSLFLRRPGEQKTRYTVYQIARRGVALALGGILALGWAGICHELFRAPAEEWIGDETALSGEVVTYPSPTSIGGYSVTIHLDGGFFAPDILAYGPADWSELKPGDRLACAARVKSSVRAWGDETTYYTARGVYLIAYCNDGAEITPA